MSVALASRIAITRRAPRILAPYNNLEFRAWFPWLRFGLMAIMVVMVAYAATLTSLGGTQLLKVATMPIMALLGVVVWMLPDVDRHAGAVPKEIPILPVLLAFLVAIVAWPSYVAVVIPGLPWLTPGRVVLAAMIIMLALHYSQYSQSRDKAVAILGYDKLAIRFFLCYEFMCVFVTVNSPDTFDSLSFHLQQEVMSLTAVLAAVFLFEDLKKIKLIYQVVVTVCIFTMLVAVLENYMQIPPWAEHIPSFMRIDDEWLARILSPQARIGDDRYRIRSTFPVVLYYALYLAATMPLVLFAISQMYRRHPILTLGVVVLIMHTVWFANARSAVIALLIPLFLLPALYLIRSFNVKKKVDVMQIAVRGAITLMLVGMLGGVLATSHRAQMMVFGGRQHRGSNDVRARQWENAFNQLKKNPVGIGHGNVQATVGVELRGKRIIDSYWINIIVGVGPIGAICYFGLFLRCAWLGLLCFFRAKRDEEELAGALGICLIGYITDQYVISNSDSMYLVILYCGLIVAIKRLQDKRIAAEQRMAAEEAGTALAPVRA